MAKERNKTLDYLAYLGLRLFAAFLHMFSVRANYRTARWIGELLWRIDKKHRRIAINQLQLSFPDWPLAKVERVARKSIINMMYLFIEVLFTPRLINPRTWRWHIKLNNLAEAIRLLTMQDTGVIMLTGHFGNWEIVGYAMATLGFPSTSIARLQDNAYINDYLLGVRERTGQTILYKKGATAAAPQVLERKGTLAFVADQDAGRKGLFVDFFGRPASTYKSIALLAIRYNVPVIVGYGKRLSDKFEFEIGTQRIIYPHEWADKENEPAWLTQQFTSALEAAIRTAPEQYWWVHRRWKHRPDGTKATGDGVA